MENQYRKQTVTMPSYLAKFECLAENCPQTCCQGWNIPVDKAHGEFYQQLPDEFLQRKVSQVVKKVRRKQGNQIKTTFHLDVMSQPQARCAFLNTQNRCELQEKYGEFALCDTCYFFPRQFLRVDQQFSMSASLSCPAVRSAAILPIAPSTFIEQETFIDPDTEWILSDDYADPDFKFILNNRQPFIENLIQLLQNRQFDFIESLQQVCAQLNRLGPESAENLLSDLETRGCELQTGTNEVMTLDIPPDRRFAETQEWIKQLDSALNWGLESASAASHAIQKDLLQLTAGISSPHVRMAENYLSIKQTSIDYFILDNRHLFENLFAHCLFSDTFTNYLPSSSGIIDINSIAHFEICRLVLTFSLLKILLVNSAQNSGNLDDSSFLEVVGELDRKYLHYPDFMRFSITRLAAAPLSNAQLISWIAS